MGSGLSGLGFVKDTIPCFLLKLEKVDKDLYFADRDLRSILDKTINDLILYLKVNWQNIVTVKNKIPEIKEFVHK